MILLSVYDTFFFAAVKKNFSWLMPKVNKKGEYHVGICNQIDMDTDNARPFKSHWLCNCSRAFDYPNGWLKNILTCVEIQFEFCTD